MQHLHVSRMTAPNVSANNYRNFGCHLPTGRKKRTAEWYGMALSEHRRKIHNGAFDPNCAACKELKSKLQEGVNHGSTEI